MAEKEIIQLLKEAIRLMPQDSTERISFREKAKYIVRKEAGENNA